jgi:hypothetical protein
MWVDNATALRGLIDPALEANVVEANSPAAAVSWPNGVEMSAMIFPPWYEYRTA